MEPLFTGSAIFSSSQSSLTLRILSQSSLALREAYPLPEPFSQAKQQPMPGQQKDAMAFMAPGCESHLEASRLKPLLGSKETLNMGC